MPEEVTTIEQIEYIERQMEWQKLFISVSENETAADILELKRDLEILEKIYANLQIDLMLEQSNEIHIPIIDAAIKLSMLEEMQC